MGRRFAHVSRSSFAAPRLLSGFTLSAPEKLRRSGLAGALPLRVSHATARDHGSRDQSTLRHLQSRFREAQQISRGKFDRRPCPTAEFTTSVFDGYGLRCHWPARPTPYASDPVLVHRLAGLLHTSFRPHLAVTPLRFAVTSSPSGCKGDFHPRAVEHARHTQKKLPASRTWRPGVAILPL